jgi:hypothetical protein
MSSGTLLTSHLLLPTATLSSARWHVNLELFSGQQPLFNWRILAGALASVPRSDLVSHVCHGDSSSDRVIEWS